MTWREDPDEVQWVGGTDRDELACLRCASGLAEGRDRLGEGVLLSRETPDETASSDSSLGLEAPVYSKELVPWREVPFAIDEPPKHDPPASEECPGNAVEIVLLGGVREDRPPTRCLHAVGGRRSTAAPRALWVGRQERSQTRETICSHQSE